MIFHTGYLPNVYIETYWLENVLDTDWELLREIIDQVNAPI